MTTERKSLREDRYQRLYRLPSGQIVDFNPLPYQIALVVIGAFGLAGLIGLLVLLA